jgi:uncharacterized circularly permuted ATP-grasp superfamily protein/uncharacterized alpha-E superfamily protein
MSITLPAKATAGGDPFRGYRPPAGSYDEFVDAAGAPRRSWQKFVASLAQLGFGELALRWEQAQRLIRENGITYNLYGDAFGQTRPWPLDALPLLLAGEEWRRLSLGLEQRARLLNLVVADVYGPRRLLTEGLIPPELIFGHPGFTRPYHGQNVPGQCYLHLYAADLVRSGEAWWVLADRTEAPSGSGYALENRIVVSQMLSQVFHDCQVQRLASYFIELRKTLRELAPQNRDNPRIVLLSQGPRNPNYFEDAYLSRYLGYTLVEGGDLAVRGNRVLLKTLSGLLPVDVILRRLDDEDCDPLELRGDSSLGVAGLLQAARSGHVVIANALGSGLVESPAFLAFLPGLCRALLGEELKLPSVATWWCGDPQAMNYVLANLNRLVIKQAFRRGAQEPIFGEHLSRLNTAQLADTIRANPYAYVGQEQITGSTAPVWNSGEVQPWNVSLRAFLVRSQEGYYALPGGLARASGPAGAGEALPAEGSKDVWVLSEGPVTHVSLLTPAGQPIELKRSGADLPSRVADNLYWLGRQVERAEGAARLLRTVFIRLASEAERESMPELPVLIRALADQGQIEPGFVVEGIRQQMPAIENELPRAMFDEQQPGSLRHTLSALYRLASMVRDRMSLDSWRILNRIEQQSQPPRRGRTLEPAEVLSVLSDVIIDLSAFAGLTTESMTRTQGWRFLDVGRRLERSLYTIGLARNAVIQLPTQEGPVLESLLEVADSLMTYRSRYLSSLQLAPVLDLILTDETNPRSLAFQLAALADHVEQLPRDRNQPQRSPEQRIMMSALGSVRMVDIEALCEVQPGGERTHLERLLSRLALQLPKLSDVISHRYLIHAGSARQLAEIRPEL